MTFTGNKAQITQFLYKLDKDTVWDIKIEKSGKKRSLNANAYSWVLQNEIANVLRESKEKIHFDMLKEYGQREQVNMLASINVAGYFDYYEEVGTFKQNGNTFKSYLIYKGTHKYNSKEMAIFIDGLVQEARNLGIETLEDIQINELIREMEKDERTR